MRSNQDRLLLADDDVAAIGAPCGHQTGHPPNGIPGLASTRPPRRALGGTVAVDRAPRPATGVTLGQPLAAPAH